MNTNGQHNNFIVSLAGMNIDMAIVNIEEMSAYCEKRGRHANVVTQKKTYDELDKLNYSLIMNYKNPKPRVVITKGKDKQFSHVYDILSEKFHGGLLIAESDTISDQITDGLCENSSWQNNDVDLIICKSFASVTKKEILKADYMRISADPDFDPSVLVRMGEEFQQLAGTIMISQYFVNQNYNNVLTYLEQKNKECSDLGMSDYIDYYELNRQLSYFIWVDTKNNKILNISKEVISDFLLSKDMRMLVPLSEKDILPYAEMITS